MSEPLFEAIDESEYKDALAAPETTATGRTRKPKYDTETRTETAWFRLPTRFGHCEAAFHEEVQEMICAKSPLTKEYRDKYPTRLVHDMPDGKTICRDCYVHGADKV